MFPIRAPEADDLGSKLPLAEPDLITPIISKIRIANLQPGSPRLFWVRRTGHCCPELSMASFQADFEEVLMKMRFASRQEL